VDYALLWYDSRTYFDKPISKHPLHMCSEYTFTGESHPWKSKRTRACLICLLSALNLITFFVGKMPWLKSYIKPWNWIFFTSFFFVLSSYDGRKNLFSFFFSIFISYFFSFFIIASLWFPWKKNSPVDDNKWTRKVLDSCKRNFLTFANI